MYSMLYSIVKLFPPLLSPHNLPVEGPRMNDLDREKRKDYRNTFILQALLLVSMLTMKDVLVLVGLGAIENATWNVYLVMLALYFYLLWDMLRNYQVPRWLRYGTLVVVVTIYLLNFLANGLFFHWNLPRTALNLGLFTAGLGVQGLVMAFALGDLLRARRRTEDKLWGSACIYFMGGFAFATAYHILHILDPGAFGVTMAADHLGLAEALYFSFNCLVGLDTAYPNAVHIVRNLAVLEGCWAQLYMVLLISRVLLPEEELAPEAAGACPPQSPPHTPA